LYTSGGGISVIYFFFWLTTIANVICLAVSLCLGLYIVTRTQRGWETWLAGLMLWSLAGFYLYNCLALTVPGNRVLLWLRPSVVFALAFGFHLALLLPARRREAGFRPLFPSLQVPGWLEQRLGTAGPAIRQLPVPVSYVLGIILIVLGAIPVATPGQPSDGPAVFLSDRPPSLLYPLVIVYLVLLFALAFMHQWQGWQGASSRPRGRQYLALLVALLLTVGGGVYLGLGVWLQADVPTFPGDVAVGMAAFVLGYAVARYNSYKEGLVLRKELLYISLVIGLFTVGYVGVAELLYHGGHVFSALTLILIVIVGVTSLMLYDGVRAALDRLFYREQFRQLRGNLRALAREAGIGQSLPERLQFVLGNVCSTLGIKRGLVALREGDAFMCQAMLRAQCVGQTYALEAAETSELPRPDVQDPEGMSLLVPIHAGDDQIGALVLGAKADDVPFSEEDLIVLEDVADQLGSLIVTAQRQEEHATVISQMVADFREREHALQRRMQQLKLQQEEARPVLEGVDEAGFARLVEDALRQLHNYTYLGEHKLAGLKVVDWHLPDGGGAFVTHIDRGKAVGEVLGESISKLRPLGEEPEPYSVPSRAWHQYLILHDAYVLGDLNRNIMSKLYISEGTFNRTRRRAVRGVAKALQEMEQEALHRKA
jgi:hypothetical protein